MFFRRSPAGLKAACSDLHSGSSAPQEPLRKETGGDRRTRPPPTAAAHPEVTAPPTAARHQPAEARDPGVSEAGSRSEGGDRAGTKGSPAPQRQQLVGGDGPTDPPFIGDTYKSEDVPPQTVNPVNEKRSDCHCVFIATSPQSVLSLWFHPNQ